MYFNNVMFAGLSGLAGIELAHKYVSKSINNLDYNIVEPVDNISIIMTSLNEEEHIEQALSSIRNQSILQKYPDRFELIVADSNSKDSTVDIAKQYADTVLNVPRGKLTARNIATDMSSGNIIVATDSDAYYPDGWLNTLLKPFHQSGVIAVHGSNIDSNVPIIGEKLFTLLHPIYITFISPYEMNGGNSAYCKHAYYLTGRFNENINQLNVKIVQKEEEIDFGQRMSKLGKVIYKINAPKIHLGGERTSCRWIYDSYKCSKYKIGIERFDGGKGEYYFVK